VRVVLKKEVAGLGRPGDVKDVADGYAQNFLLPRGLATVASAGELRRVASEKQTAKAKKDRQHVDAEELAEKLAATTVVFKLKVGPQGKAFGSVTARDVADALSREKLEVPHDKIHLDDPIRSLGPHEVEVRLLSDVRARVTVTVEAESA
jgi:large subunit ribosomal protein L9